MHTTPDPQPTWARRAMIGLAAGVAVASAGGIAAAWASDDGSGTATGPDPLRAEQWAIDELRLPEAWSTTTGCGTTIAIVDSGVDLDHPDLRDRLVPGIDLVDGDDDPDDENGHGTHVAGIAAGSAGNATGITGAAPCARIMPVRVLGADGSGDDATIAEGIRWAAEHGADVINLSLGEAGILGRLHAGGEMNEAIIDAHELGSVVVAASGNEGTPRFRNYHLDVPVIIVGATGPGGEPAEFSNFGDPRTLVAPGVGILSTVPTDATTIFPDGTDGYEELDGTSMASPYVAGVAALLVAQGYGPDDVESILVDTAHDPGDDPRLGAGLVDAGAALGRGLAGG